MNLASDELKTENSSKDIQKKQVLCLAVFPRAGFKIDAELVSFPLYWLEGHEAVDHGNFVGSALGKALVEVLCDPLQDELWFSLGGKRKNWLERFTQEGFRWFAERQFQPGVTDNLARTVEEALHLKGISSDVKVASGMGFLSTFSSEADPTELEETGKYVLYHPLTDRFKVHDIDALYNRFFSFPAVHLPERPEPAECSLDLDDAGLMSLSKERLLALNLNEMRAIRTHYQKAPIRELRKKEGLPEWPTDVELEVIAQTWSEHCKHKIFSAEIIHNEPGRQSEKIDSLYKTYIQSPTYELMEKRKDLLSVFEDNSGVVRFNQDWAYCFKVETHNSPSALEPYGGALTGILGVNRDVLGTGLGAKPIFNTDVFCFAYPSEKLPQAAKLLPAETIIRGVRKGVQDGGNKSGIPTVNGAVCFHDGYRAKPLVFCGTGGILPLEIDGRSAIEKHTQIADCIVMVGGRVGKDGIHGATFSSEALHEGSPVTAVQIGDPFTQKRMIDFILEARDQGLLSGITDNGAGGLSSSVGEMARITGGAELELDQVPLKYPGLADYEIVISESQERMTLSTSRLQELMQLAEKFNVECTCLGKFNSDGYFKITRQGKILALLDLDFLHKGVPKLELESEWTPSTLPKKVGPEVIDLKELLLRILSHPNVCSREYLIRQYDHEVQGASVIKPLMGANQKAACDAAVIAPIAEDRQGLVISNGICPQMSEFDPELMAYCAVDEAVRNAVCVGADPGTLVLLDNFCWPDPVQSSSNPDAKRKLAQLTMCCRALARVVKSYGAPLISGKDSMKNDFDDGKIRLSIPPTLLVSCMGKINDLDKCLSMEFKNEGDLIYIVSAASIGLTASLISEILDWTSTESLPQLDEAKANQMYRCLHEAIQKGLLKSAHDLSEGGLGVALAESSIGSGLGARILSHRMASAAAACIQDADPLTKELMTRLDFALFAEGPARILVSIDPKDQKEWEEHMKAFSCIELGKVSGRPELEFVNSDAQELFTVPVSELVSAWESMLPFEEDFNVEG